MSEPVPTSPAPHDPAEGHWAIGVGLALGLALGVTLILWLAAFGFQVENALPFLLVPGVTQLVWILPLAFVLNRQKRMRTFRGLLIGAGLVFLLNGACWGLFVGAMAS